MNSHKDFNGESIEIGSEVIFYNPNYRHFDRGRIIKITPKMVVISYVETHGGRTKEFRQFPSQVIVRD